MEGFSQAKKKRRWVFAVHPPAELIFENVKVPKRICWATGQGFRIAMSTLDSGRTVLPPKRWVFPKVLWTAISTQDPCTVRTSDFHKQGLQWMMADMHVHRSSSSAGLQSGFAKDHQKRFTVEAAMANCIFETAMELPPKR